MRLPLFLEKHDEDGDVVDNRKDYGCWGGVEGSAKCLACVYAKDDEREEDGGVHEPLNCSLPGSDGGGLQRHGKESGLILMGVELRVSFKSPRLAFKLG